MHRTPGWEWVLSACIARGQQDNSETTPQIDVVKSISSRREARERVMQALYAFEMGGGDQDEVEERVLVSGHDGKQADMDFATRLYRKTIDGSVEADAIISHHAKNWEFSRIALLDKLLLRMAICEILWFEDIPPKVSINEAIEIAKKFSTAKSGQFINGILDASLLALRSENRITKTGRGLIDVSGNEQREDASKSK